MTTRLCIICHKRPPRVPDRSTTSRAKRVCGECHAARLGGDLRRILAITDPPGHPSAPTERKDD